MHFIKSCDLLIYNVRFKGSRRQTEYWVQTKAHSVKMDIMFWNTCNQYQFLKHACESNYLFIMNQQTSDGSAVVRRQTVPLHSYSSDGWLCQRYKTDNSVTHNLPTGIVQIKDRPNCFHGLVTQTHKYQVCFMFGGDNL